MGGPHPVRVDCAIQARMQGHGSSGALRAAEGVVQGPLSGEARIATRPGRETRHRPSKDRRHKESKASMGARRARRSHRTAGQFFGGRIANRGERDPASLAADTEVQGSLGHNPLKHALPYPLP
jgi:hypothetical protein